MKKFNLLTAFVFVILATSCSKQDIKPVSQPETINLSSTVATDWMYSLQRVVQIEGKNPPVASRIYAYAAIGLYEAVVPGMPDNRSLQGQIMGLSGLPQAHTYGSLDFAAVANESLYHIALNIFGSLTPQSKKIIDDLHKKYQTQLLIQHDESTFENSTAFGRLVANAVLNRAAGDGYSKIAMLQYVMPNNPGSWVPTEPGQKAIEPYWGQLQCFAMNNSGECTIKSDIPFSTAPASTFYQAAQEVYEASLLLTNDQKAIAHWWSDGSSQTATPPGHWVAIADQIIRKNKVGLARAAEVYAMLNIAMADAFISCWDEKYKCNLLRPVTYIQKYIPGQASWQPLLSTPPFPEYPSGHSVASGAAGDMLNTFLGSTSFTDSANVYLGYKPRHYQSFDHAVQEAAISRLYGGIHFREAIENGVLQGKEVGRVIKEKIKLRR